MFKQRIAILAVAAALVVGGGSVFAGPDGKGGRPQRGEGRAGGGGHGPGARGMGIEKLLEQLDLTEAQKVQVAALQAQTRQQFEALRSDESVAPEQRREKAREIHQNFVNQLNQILTPQQQEQLAQLRQKAREGGPREGGPRGGERKRGEHKSKPHE
jgi:Spy/CpxP family protein refolding chaperone